MNFNYYYELCTFYNIKRVRVQANIRAVIAISTNFTKYLNIKVIKLK